MQDGPVRARRLCGHRCELPDTERQSHHFYSRLARQYDTSTQIDDTRVLELLDVGPVRIDGEVP